MIKFVRLSILILSFFDLRASIHEYIENPFFISKEQVGKILHENPHLTLDQLLIDLVPLVQKKARPLISEYHVGVVGLGRSGNIYGGVNLEFQNLTSAVHAEQCMLINARGHGEAFIEKLALSATPCGHCRQFLYEIGHSAGNIECLILQKKAVRLAELLPSAFGPDDLGIKGGFLSQVEIAASLDPVERAKEAAKASYVPYSGCASGVAIVVDDGRVFSGSYLENAAYNPTVPPLQAALVEIVANGIEYDQIARVILAQTPLAKIHQYNPTISVLNKICPNVQLEIVDLD